MAQALALIAQQVANFLQFENDPVDFLNRCPGDTTDQLIQAFGTWAIDRASFAQLLLQPREVAANELADLPLERVCRRLLDVAQLFPCARSGGAYSSGPNSC